MQTNELSFEEVERMRQILAQHDAQRKPMQTIDLNNPPKEPYRFQKFPKMIYGAGDLRMTVRSEAQLQDALNDGWSEEPPVAVEVIAQPLSASLQMEVERVEAQLAEARRAKRKGSEAA